MQTPCQRLAVSVSIDSTSSAVSLQSRNQSEVSSNRKHRQKLQVFICKVNLMMHILYCNIQIQTHCYNAHTHFLECLINMKSLCINNSFCCQPYHHHFSSSHRTEGYHGKKKEFHEIQVTTDHYLKAGIRYSAGTNGLMWYSVYNEENI